MIEELNETYTMVQTILLKRLFEVEVTYKDFLTSKQKEYLSPLSASIKKDNSVKPKNDKELLLGLSSNIMHLKNLNHVINFEYPLIEYQHD